MNRIKFWWSKLINSNFLSIKTPKKTKQLKLKLFLAEAAL